MPPMRVGVTSMHQSSDSRCGAGIDLADRDWWGEGMATPAAFVGREDELSRLLAALANQTRLVLVVGDAGVGKTRLAGEAMARAAVTGMVTVRGECLPLGEQLPLLPVAAALNDLARLDSGGLLDAALHAAPEYVRGEVGRLLPRLGSGSGPEQGGWEQGWQRGRLFLAVAELLDAAARSSGAGVALVVEDVHWADSASLDFLTFLTRAGYRDAVTVVATCRGDEAPAAHVADWLAQVRGAAGVEEIRVRPLSRAELAGQVAGLAGGPVQPRVVDELYARAEGNPFFTEQLVAATLADTSEGGSLQVPAGLPARLAELLAARAGRCAGHARAVLAGLAVAGRPLAEDPLAAVTGLDAVAVRDGLRELAAARLLAEDTSGGEYGPRHALLAEAVAAGLLPGERAALHGSMARALAATGDDRVAEVAGHWQAAGNPAAELPARIAAAEAAERVFGYAEAAAHWQRAIELGQALPGAGDAALGQARPGAADTVRAVDPVGAADAAGIGVPQMYVRAIDTLDWSGAGVRAERVAEEAFRRFAGHADPAIAAAVCHRAGRWRATGVPDAGLALIKEALRLFEQAPPSADQAEAWLDYADLFLWSAGGWSDGTVPALNRALTIAEATGATALIPRVLARIAASAFRRGQVEEGFAVLGRGWTLARAMDDVGAQVWLAANESDALLKLANFAKAAEVAMRALGPARDAGLQASWRATILASNASEALLAGGRTAEAAALIDPLITGPPDRDSWLVHLARADIDLLRGDAGAAAARRRLTDAIPARLGYYVDYARESAQRAVELAVWAGRPGDALEEVRRVLGLFKVSDLTIFCGRLLATGMRACADLAEQARAHRDEPAAHAAEAAADDLASWVDHMAGAPFAEHRFAATSPAERASWDAERTRLAGASDPEAWGRAAKTWEGLSCPHRAGYAWWRHAQAQLDAGQPAGEATAALRAAAAAADGHAPLLAQVRLLAERARIPLQPQAQPQASDASQAPPERAPARYGLTGRELAVLRLLATGRSNAQIGAELYISPSTASVHVTSILRKLGVSSRVQAAALAERAGLLPPGPS
jgi:DNA-binding CsgD family transcriptional regulator